MSDEPTVATVYLDQLLEKAGAENATLKARVAELVGALSSVLPSSEGHDDSCLCTSCTARVTLDKHGLTTPAKPFKLRDKFTEEEWAERETWGDK